MFLETSQNSQENTCIRVSFLIKSQEFCEISKGTFSSGYYAATIQLLCKHGSYIFMSSVLFLLKLNYGSSRELNLLVWCYFVDQHPFQINHKNSRIIMSLDVAVLNLLLTLILEWKNLMTAQVSSFLVFRTTQYLLVLIRYWRDLERICVWLYKQSLQIIKILAISIALFRSGIMDMVSFCTAFDAFQSC